MKRFSILHLLIAITAIPAGVSEAAHLVLAPVNHAYSPKGFDTNDEAQVIVSGYLPNLCYQAQRPEVSINGRTITITMKALLDTQFLCAQVIVPYLEAVPVGVLEKGKYQVVVKGAFPQIQSSEIEIEPAATPALDNHVYANVSSIEQTEGSRRIVLKGTNPTDCFELDRVEYVSNGKDTYSVLPILKQTRPDCPKKKVPFSIDTVVPDTLNYEEILLHVRVMDGKSVNSILE